MSENKTEIPKTFKLFGTTINIVWDNRRMNEREAYGLHNYSTSTITLCHTDGIEQLSHGRMMDTYYHERTHAILEAMGENELSQNEKFVDLLAKLTRQADESAKY